MTNLADFVPSLNWAVSAVAVTLADAVQAASPSSMVWVTAEVSVTVLLAWVHVAFWPRLVGDGDCITRTVSPAAGVMAVSVFFLRANEVPALPSEPLTRSTNQ